MRKTSTTPSTTPRDAARYEIVERGKTGLYVRDGLPYVGLHCASRAAKQMRRAGSDVRVVPFRPIHERLDLRTAVA